MDVSENAIFGLKTVLTNTKKNWCDGLAFAAPIYLGIPFLKHCLVPAHLDY